MLNQEYIAIIETPQWIKEQGAKEVIYTCELLENLKKIQEPMLKINMPKEGKTFYTKEGFKEILEECLEDYKVEYTKFRGVAEFFLRDVEHEEKSYTDQSFTEEIFKDIFKCEYEQEKNFSRRIVNIQDVSEKKDLYDSFQKDWEYLFSPTEEDTPEQYAITIARRYAKVFWHTIYIKPGTNIAEIMKKKTGFYLRPIMTEITSRHPHLYKEAYRRIEAKNVSGKKRDIRTEAEIYNLASAEDLILTKLEIPGYKQIILIGGGEKRYIFSKIPESAKYLCIKKRGNSL